MTTLSAADEAELKAMLPAMEAAWRNHDAEAYAAQFAPDADHINAYGMWWRGQSEIREGIGFALNVIYPTNPISASDVEVESIADGVALVRYRWRLQPYADRDGHAYDDPNGRITQLVMRTPEGWRIRSFQSTFVNPGVPHTR